MADETTHENAPEGFWEEMGKWLTSDPEGRKRVFDAFVNKDAAPPPPGNDDKDGKNNDKDDTPPKKKGGWFG